LITEDYRVEIGSSGIAKNFATKKLATTGTAYKNDTDSL